MRILRGPLHERQFRLLFAGRTISMLGSAMAPVALAFAVLNTLHGNATDIGIVLAARQIPVVLLLLFGGVWSDRLPRNQVMVASNLLSGLSQAAVAVLLLAGNASLGELAALAAVNGASSAFFFPASTGVLPQTVTTPMLQQANAALRLSLNATNIIGTALGGVIVAASNPGVAIAIDAVSYFVAAIALGAMRLPPSVRTAGSTVAHELRAGWRDFWSRTWLWAIVLQFGFVNAAEGGALNVLGPGVAKHHLGGPAGWAAVLAAESIGLVSCGFLMLRWRPRRMLFVASLAIFPLALPMLALARPETLVIVVLTAFAAGFCVEIFGVLWDTSLQQEIPQEMLSRISSYDALGSIALSPIGLIVAGPLAAAIGDRAAFLGAAALVVTTTAGVMFSRNVRTLERRA